MRLFDASIRTLLRSPSLKMRLLMAFNLDEGTFRFCDDVVDVTDGTYLWVGAGVLGGQLEYRSGRDLAAEPMTLTLDGNHMTQAGVSDPARVLRDIMTYIHTQRRVDVFWGLAYPDSVAIQLRVPIAAMKINSCRMIDEKVNWEDPKTAVTSKLEITLDSLAMRYARATYRTRSHSDQQEIDPTDNFFSFTADAPNTERSLFWGKSGSTSGGGFGGVTSGPFSNVVGRELGID